MPSAPTYYELQAPAPARRPALAGVVEVETCIIGGGLAGLATLLSLAERGHQALLLEGARIGGGASGRNGGMASAGLTLGAGELERALGAEAAHGLFALSRDGLDLLRGRIKRHAIPCGVVDGVVVASWFDAPQPLAAEARRHNAAYGTRLRHWTREEVRGLYRTTRYHGALFDPDGFHLDPLALCRGLAEAAEGHGAVIAEGSPVLGLARTGAGFELTTPGGRIRARRVVLCQSAYGPAILPRLARATLPVATYVIVTEPLGGQDVIRGPYAVYDDRFATGYYRLLGDGRLLWGGRISLREVQGSLVPLMRRDLALVFPQLRGVGIDFAWSGRMGFARHRMPILGEIEPGLWAATCFGGHGLNTTAMAGELIASALAEGDGRWRQFRAFPPRWVGGWAGRLAAQGLFHAHGLKDGLRAAWLNRRAEG